MGKDNAAGNSCGAVLRAEIRQAGKIPGLRALAVDKFADKTEFQNIL